MPNKDNKEEQIVIKNFVLDDGRQAERHITFDENGNEIVEVFAEEKRPLKLEKRIHREYKNIVAKETHETIKDGEVAHVEIRTNESDVPLKIVERIGVADHAKIVDGDYIRKDEIGKAISDGVVAGISALMENMDSVPSQVKPEEKPTPIFKAQSVIENNVSEKNKKDQSTNLILGLILLAQLAFFGYMFFMM